MFATFKSLFRENTIFDNMEAMPVQVPMTSRGMLGNIFTLFQSLLSPRWAMFTTLKSLSGSYAREKMLPFLDLISAYLWLCGAKYPDIQVPISRTRPLDSDF